MSAPGNGCNAQHFKLLICLAMEPHIKVTDLLSFFFFFCTKSLSLPVRLLGFSSYFATAPISFWSNFPAVLTLCWCFTISGPLDSLRDIGTLVYLFFDVFNGPLDDTLGKDFGIAPCNSNSLSDMEISNSAICSFNLFIISPFISSSKIPDAGSEMSKASSA
jgi:hypothetical protein